MSFSCPVELSGAGGLTAARVRITLTVGGSAGSVDHLFRFDTGADITVVGEDVATQLGLPSGGAPVRVTGATATVVGRLVSATFRFPPDATSGSPSQDVSSTWAVVAGRTNLALVSLCAVHAWYHFNTDDTDIYFTDR